MADSRHRIFFLTIHKNAECFDQVKELIECGEWKQWAYIIHDRDVEEDGTLTPAHYHAIIELENGRTFNSISKVFKGAHIEIPITKKGTYRYLIHNTDKSKGKAQYEPELIICKSRAYVEEQLSPDTDYEPFEEDKVLQYMAEDCITAYRFLMRFGFTAWSMHWKNYFQLIRELQNDTEGYEAVCALRRDLRGEDEENTD